MFIRSLLLLGFALGLASSLPAAPLGTAFTYEGRLLQNGAAVNGTTDLQFRLWDDASTGTQIGTSITLNGVTVANGLFTAQLNAAGEFGPDAFKGEQRWLEIIVNGTPLSP